MCIEISRPHEVLQNKSLTPPPSPPRQTGNLVTVGFPTFHPAHESEEIGALHIGEVAADIFYRPFGHFQSRTLICSCSGAFVGPDHGKTTNGFRSLLRV